MTACPETAEEELHIPAGLHETVLIYWFLDREQSCDGWLTQWTFTLLPITVV